jgi:hypothetical protein
MEQMFPSQFQWSRLRAAPPGLEKRLLGIDQILAVFEAV